MKVSKDQEYMVFRELNRLGDEINNEFDNVNFGGCGVVASAVAQGLGEYMPCQIIVYYLGDELEDEPESAKEIRENGGWNNSTMEKLGYDLCHVVVGFNMNGTHYEWDSNGITVGSKLPGYDKMKGDIRPEEMNSLDDDPDGWNPDFDRHQIEPIRSMIEYFFSGQFDYYWNEAKNRSKRAA